MVAFLGLDGKVDIFAGGRRGVCGRSGGEVEEVGRLEALCGSPSRDQVLTSILSVCADVR